MGWFLGMNVMVYLLDHSANQSNAEVETDKPSMIVSEKIRIEPVRFYDGIYWYQEVIE